MVDAIWAKYLPLDFQHWIYLAVSMWDCDACALINGNLQYWISTFNSFLRLSIIVIANTRSRIPLIRCWLYELTIYSKIGRSYFLILDQESEVLVGRKGTGPSKVSRR